jgi:hypothetical protein
VLLLASFASLPLRAFDGLLLQSITNPAPAINDFFGYSVAGLGLDRLIIGSYNHSTGALEDGVAYLFNIDGTHLVTFTNPTPAVADSFGYSVAAVGIDCVLIGALNDGTSSPYSGAAYLFSTNGTLLRTFTKPGPTNYANFGCCLSGVGPDKILIGAQNDCTGATNTGAVYLFGTNGSLLTVFTNPIPAAEAHFGCQVAVMGTDRVLIGASHADLGAKDGGAAYLFSINGSLLTTFTNPIPTAGDNFGEAVAVLGLDKVAIGVPLADRGEVDSGAVYVYRTNGTLLATIINPTSEAHEWFGASVIGIDANTVIIGSPRDNKGVARAGAAYLFSATGNLLTTITNPTPLADDYFGFSMAAVGSEKVLVGAFSDDTGSSGAGAAYLFTIPPLLSITLTFTNTAILDWPLTSVGYRVQQSTDATVTGSWNNITETINKSETRNFIVVPWSAQTKYYRLIRP